MLLVDRACMHIYEYRFCFYICLPGLYTTPQIGQWFSSVFAQGEIIGIVLFLFYTQISLVHTA